MESPHYGFSLKKVITSAHSESSNSPVFNPVLPKFFEVICEIIVSKTLCGIFLIFCWSSFINNLMVNNNFLELKNYRKLNISRLFILKKIPRTVLWVLSVQISRKNFFVKNFCFKDVELFSRLQNHWFVRYFFSTKKLLSYFLSRVII